MGEVGEDMAFRSLKGLSEMQDCRKVVEIVCPQFEGKNNVAY